MAVNSISVVVAGSGGAGSITAGTVLLEAAGEAGWYAYMTRSTGAQIRGGEAAAMIRFSNTPVNCHEGTFHILLGIDWKNLGKYASEFCLTRESLIISDPKQGEVPPEIVASGAREALVPLKQIARSIERGRPNMIAVGIVARLIGLPFDAVVSALEKTVGSRKGEEAMASSLESVRMGMEEAAGLTFIPTLAPPRQIAPRWSITGNKATGLGAVKCGIRYVAAYPITPATEILEWMAPALDKVGGTLVQVEDELASINQIIGSSYGGVPSFTATSGPGLSLMIESIGLAVASETPIVIVDVMRGGPSTGLPTRSEQTDLNIALHGMHGEAPHLVLAPNSVIDCMRTAGWAVQLAEALQTAAIVLSDQSLGQAQAIVDAPGASDFGFTGKREVFDELPEGETYLRYKLTDSGVSPMAIPGTRGCQYTADGLTHSEGSLPSSTMFDHVAQMDKRERKLTAYDYGDYWADIEGKGETAVITWGSSTNAVREALTRLREEGKHIRLISIRLLFPVQPKKLSKALDGVTDILIIEQSHSGQFARYLRADYDLRGVRSYHRPGPLLLRPDEIYQQLAEGSQL